MKRTLLMIAILTGLISCDNSNETSDEQLKQEIYAIEKAFNDMAAEKGVKEAFLYYAADSAVLSRGNRLIRKNGMEEYFNGSTYSNVVLTWAPDFADVSKSGDLAYTYGQFTFSALDANGDSLSSSGIFHTVWKRQEDGTWRYVWD